MGTQLCHSTCSPNYASSKSILKEPRETQQLVVSSRASDGTASRMEHMGRLWKMSGRSFDNHPAVQEWGCLGSMLQLCAVGSRFAAQGVHDLADTQVVRVRSLPFLYACEDY
jgi:hypothetical protein